MSGLVAGIDRKACEEIFIRNFRHVADRLAPHGITLLVEPINSRNMPGYSLIR